ncbi:PTPLA-domain-containing protein [Rhizodiscina lignyota]|uniref:Very-long-chain (3R)-3-hydroxyacyl-CoA dehydratase n=1 Tax=Rhizodiscina lignyota TaxID=1504668 RepID=A0A9P4IT75_9PEZI|nr:PTPLA-domain-containing protein [Rhizodiscina lignyota]
MYLAFYNLISALMWGLMLGRVVSVAPFYGNYDLNRTTGGWVQWVQTMAVAEIFHSLFGLVRAPLFTTLIQVASRIIIVWGIYPNFPSVPAQHWQNSTMLFAWSTTEVIRYTYFFSILGGLDEMPALLPYLKWARYNTFFALYPIGIASECYLIYKTIPLASKVDENYGLALKAVLAAYVPGTIVLYTHMIRQRNKVMKKDREGKKDEKKTQ